MSEAFIGSFIRQRREDLGLSQYQLCEGICGLTTMSRLECGSQTPSRNVVNALLQRLGLPSDRYLTLLNRNEIEINALKDDIQAKQILHQHAIGPEKDNIRFAALGEIAQLEKLCPIDDNLTKQYILYHRTILGHEDGSWYSPEKRLAMLLNAIRLTVPRFEVSEINSFIYCMDEVKIINSIAHACEDLGEMQTALTIFKQLVQYIQSHFQDILNTRGELPMIAHNYARALNLCGQNTEALKAIETAHQACIKYRNYQMLPRILHTKAIIYHDLGNHEQGKRLYYQAYHVCMAIDDHRDLSLLCADANEQYGITFD